MEEKLKKIKILVIDSDEMMRIYFRDIFWIHGRSDEYDVMTASTLEEAEKMIFDKNTRPDTLFLDTTVPVSKAHPSSSGIKNAIEFITKIKDDKELCKIKVILHSGHKEDSFKNSFSKLSIDGFLLKGESTPKEVIAYTDKIHGTRCNN